jgi:hypothetical protein
MQQLLIMILLFSALQSNLIYDFTKNTTVKNWVVVDDVVMGGESSSSMKLNKDGHGVFEGSISLDNNGGFSSVRYRFPKKQINLYHSIMIRVQGDGKQYELRLKSDSNQYFSYIVPFTTNGAWQEIEIPLKNFYPSFRGRKLNQPNFSQDTLEEITFLIGNKKNEDFKLTIDKIELR